MTTRFGNYELIRPLGAGGMAQTFLAVRKGPAGFQQKVCVKRVLPEFVRDGALIEQFLDEARLLAHLRHGNIVQVYDFGQADNSYFMALELVEGADLQVLVRHLRSQDKALSHGVTLHIIGELLNALHYAHNAQLDGEPLHLVHRDISPSNVLLSKSGEVKLADFGIAKSRHRSHKTETGLIKGKVAYMSPEQVRGEELDARSDLFAVGVMLFELLTGVHPFDAATDIQVLTSILTGTRPPITAFIPDLRPDLVAMVDALMAMDRSQRPASAGDALALLPALMQPFVAERQIAELVSECMAERERLAPMLPEPVEMPSTPLTAPPTSARPTTGGARTPTGLRKAPGAPPTLEMDASDIEWPPRKKRSSAPVTIGVIVAVSVGLGGWVGYRLTHPPEEPTANSAPTPMEPTPTSAPRNELPAVGAEAEPSTAIPAASKPLRTVERDEEPEQQQAEEQARDIRVRSAEKVERERRPPREESGKSRTRRPAESKAVANTPPAPQEVRREEPKPEPAPQPTTSKAKHRTGISVSADEF